MIVVNTKASVPSNTTNVANLYTLHTRDVFITQFVPVVHHVVPRALITSSG